MSGGYFDYLDSQLKYEVFGFADKCSNVFEDRQISELIWDVLELIHEFDWYKSGDSGRDDYFKAKREFKDKWLSRDEDGSRAKQFIEKALNDVRRELYDTFDVEGGDSDG